MSAGHKGRSAAGHEMRSAAFPLIVPTAAQVRREPRRLGTARDPRSPLRRLIDSPDALFGGGMAVGLVSGGLTTLPDKVSGAVTQAATAPLVGPVALLAVALAAKLLLTVGPVTVSSASASWLLSAPVDRRSLLLGRFGAALLAGGLGGGVLFAVLGAFAGRAAVPVTVVGVPLGVLVTALTVLAQRVPARVVVAQRALSLVAVVAVLLLAVALVAGPGWAPPTNPWWPSCVTAAALALVAVAHRRLGGLTRAPLTEGTRLVDATRAAATWLDPAMLADVLAARRARSIGRVRSARLRGVRAVVVLHAELVRLRRNGIAVVVWAGLVVVPYAAARVLPDAAVGVAHLVAAFLATERLAPGLRVIARNAALRRVIGGGDRELKLLHLVVPAAATLLWCVATYPALPVIAPVITAVSALGAIAVTYRLATRPDLDYSSGIVLDTPFGVVPANIVRQVMRGPGLLLVLVLVQITVVTG